MNVEAGKREVQILSELERMHNQVRRRRGLPCFPLSTACGVPALTAWRLRKRAGVLAIAEPAAEPCGGDLVTQSC